MALATSFGSPLTDELAHGVRELDLEPPEPPTRTSRTPAVATRASLRGIDGAIVEVGAHLVMIGRPATGAGPDLTVDDPTVSRRQVGVWCAAGAILCVDLGSRNGTCRRRDDDVHPVATAVAGATLLLPGDELVTAAGTLLATVVHLPAGS